MLVDALKREDPQKLAQLFEELERAAEKYGIDLSDNPFARQEVKPVKHYSVEELIKMFVSALERERKQLREERKQIREEGRQEGEIIGEIRATQRFLKRQVSSVEELAQRDTPTLRRLLQDLEQELASMN
jgi:DNA repair exonuclease SbcCD ATPase subunit